MPTPAGVTFNVAQAVNDAGQILVWSNGWSEDTTACTSYLLTPALPGDANVDGRVDVNDLTVVLTNFGQTGMSWETGDFTGDGKVDVNDLTIVLADSARAAVPLRPAQPPCRSRAQSPSRRGWLVCGLRCAKASVDRHA